MAKKNLPKNKIVAKKIVSKAKGAVKANVKSSAKLPAKPLAKQTVKPVLKQVAKQPPHQVVKAAAKTKDTLKASAQAASKLSLKPATGKNVSVKDKSKGIVKPTAKAALKSLSKANEDSFQLTAQEDSSEESKPSKKMNPKSMGSSLIEMAKEEMAAVKIGQTAEKVEKASKFKSIKVERGNLADEKSKWQELNKRHGKDKAAQYKMTDSFESMTPIQHKVLGWGFILTNDNNRLEVLFENGIKMLISNYKPN